MGTGEWLANNSFNLLSAIGILGSLWFTSVSLRSETKTRRVANLLTITANHREVWKVFLTDKELARVRDILADTTKQPVTDAERVFVTFVIVHMSSVFYAMSDQLVVKVEGMRRDGMRMESRLPPRPAISTSVVSWNNPAIAIGSGRCNHTETTANSSVPKTKPIGRTARFFPSRMRI